MSRKVFTAGEVLAASDVNSFLMDQTVMSFADAAARGLAIPTPVEGMSTFLEDSNILSIYDGSDWKNSVGTTGGILQVIQTVKSDTFSVASTSYANITGLSASITPTSTTSKVLIILSLGTVDATGNVLITGDITRAGTQIGIGDVAGSRTSGGWARTPHDSNRNETVVYTLLDSPATTSSTTYQARIRSNSSTVFVNRTSGDSNSSINPRTISTITLMEVSA
jgi:hypothetical protein